LAENVSKVLEWLREKHRILPVKSSKIAWEGQQEFISAIKGVKTVIHSEVIIGQLWIPGAIDSGKEGTRSLSFENVMPLNFSG
jgi:hypothetical protein